MFTLRTKIIAGLLLISSGASAEMCDMQKHCYPDQPYYDLKGNRVAPPAPQYPQPKPLPAPVAQATISSNICKLARIRTSPDMPAQIVEICTMSDEEEKMYRERQRQSQASIPQMYMKNFLVPPGGY
jgi:hypothetical protein